MKQVDIPMVQARFFGLSYQQVQEANSKVSDIVTKLGATSPEGLALIELQGVIEDLSAYADKLRSYETDINRVIANRARQSERPRNRRTA